jgi:hypothetical protein
VSLSIGACWGTRDGGGGVRFLGILRDIWRALEREHLSLRELCYGTLEGGPFYGDLEGYGEESSGDGR